MQARSDILIPGVSAYYHCTTRCVRRAFLCGADPYSSRNFEHRRGWIRDRLATLVECFAIELLAYAAMCNHLHSLVRTRPDLASQWSDQEVARRWLTIFPGNVKSSEPDQRENRILAIASNPQLVALYRERLSSVSWFNRCLNEHIARRANAEDNVTGRFWEGRFKCELLTDARAILACSVYVDLNAVRAGLAETPETSDFTSIQDRIAAVTNGLESTCGPRLLATASVFGDRFDELAYISIVDVTGRLIRSGKGSVPQILDPILQRVGIKCEQWLTITTRFGALFHRIAGTVDQLRDHARAKKRAWFKGISSARMVFGTT